MSATLDEVRARCLENYQLLREGTLQVHLSDNPSLSAHFKLGIDENALEALEHEDGPGFYASLLCVEEALLDSTDPCRSITREVGDDREVMLTWGALYFNEEGKVLGVGIDLGFVFKNKAEPCSDAYPSNYPRESVFGVELAFDHVASPMVGTCQMTHLPSLNLPTGVVVLTFPHLQEGLASGTVQRC